MYRGPMKLLVCGGRDYADRTALYDALDRVLFRRGIAVLVHGACHKGGADQLADDWARLNGIVVDSYPVIPGIDGAWPEAGPRRNQRMLEASRPDGVVAFPRANGELGSGTLDMCQRAAIAGVAIWFPGKHRGVPGNLRLAAQHHIAV